MMTREWPLRKLHEDHARVAGAGGPVPSAEGAQRPGAARGARAAGGELETVVYRLPGDEASAGPSGAGAGCCELVGTYGSVELEYAAVRRGAGMLDCGQRGTLVVKGTDRVGFLNRMVTAELKNLTRGSAVESFWLNRKGRIEADLLIAELGDRMVVGVDLAQAANACRTLNEFVFSEDVVIEDATDGYWHIAVHGPRALEAIGRAANDDVLMREGIKELEAREVRLGGASAVVVRADHVGEAGLQVMVPRADVAEAWRALASAGAKPVGWHAYNIARIEGGTALFNIDYGTTNLPHETGVLRRRVHFAKGCYVGQEVVARMENLGKPKQMLVGLRMKTDALPVAGGQVFEASGVGSGEMCEGEVETMGRVIGVVTSSAIAPMLGAQPAAFAMIRTAHTAAGTEVLVNAEGRQVRAEVCGLGSWRSRT